MIQRLWDFIAGREPVLASTGLAAVVTAAIGVLSAAGVWDPNPELVAAIGALVAALAGFAARPVVTPTVSPAERKVKRLLDRQTTIGGTDTVADDTRLPDEGGVPLSMIILLVAVFLILGGLFATCDALWEDPDEENDLGLPALVVNHDCDYYGDCGGDRYGYGSDYGSEDQNRNRGRNRGAFSPGPFDDSPVDAFNNACLPGATCYYDGQRGDEPPPEEARA